MAPSAGVSSAPSAADATSATAVSEVCGACSAGHGGCHHVGAGRTPNATDDHRCPRVTGAR
ncbi:hypothetical protein CKY47_18760 [Saccharothrix yanglingensis]|uniref:Uncharacterized protein n=1 Tax=Saccharothrix yanglingensis TaxID=659496 RepID=A0ABU0X2Z9_9PSEU|nr:hypothetical protein [Saccharothrix yanglingensis]